MGHMGQSAGSRRLVPIAKPSPSLNVSGSYDTAIDNVATLTDAPIPTHQGMIWVHTSGRYLYDTPSGDLEIGDHAVQSDGSSTLRSGMKRNHMRKKQVIAGITVSVLAPFVTILVMGHSGRATESAATTSP